MLVLLACKNKNETSLRFTKKSPSLAFQLKTIYRISVEFEVDGKTYNKHTDVIVQLEEEEEEEGARM